MKQPKTPYAQGFEDGEWDVSEVSPDEARRQVQDWLDQLPDAPGTEAQRAYFEGRLAGIESASK